MDSGLVPKSGGLGVLVVEREPDEKGTLALNRLLSSPQEGRIGGVGASVD